LPQIVLHRLDALACQLVARLEDGAVILDLVLVPAITDAEQEAAIGELVDGRDFLGGDDRSRCTISAMPVPTLSLVVTVAAAFRTRNGSMMS
jgi:hypothetical protein